MFPLEDIGTMPPQMLVLVVCGPKLAANAPIPDVVVGDRKPNWEQHRFLERQFGANDVREITRGACIANNIDGVSDQVFFTRYGDIVNEVGALIEEGVLRKEQVLLVLETCDDSYNKQLHYFDYDDQGMILGEWPYGVLG